MDDKQTKICNRCKMEIPIDAKTCPYCRSSQTHAGAFGCLAFVCFLLILLLKSCGW
jgi:RNA polymerase subunit RPABC4/transcription elongation factor Spt4